PVVRGGGNGRRRLLRNRLPARLPDRHARPRLRAPGVLPGAGLLPAVRLLRRGVTMATRLSRLQESGLLASLLEEQRARREAEAEAGRLAAYCARLLGGCARMARRLRRRACFPRREPGPR